MILILRHVDVFLFPLLKPSVNGPRSQEGKAYNAWKALGQSKTAILLWNIALGKRLADKGVSTFVVHPGSESLLWAIQESYINNIEATLETKYLENSGVDQEQLAEAYKLATEREEGK